MHIRQIALVARSLEPVVEDLCAVFGLEVGFRDPGVAEFGLHNAVIPVGSTFLEVVSPVRPDATASRFLARRGGDGGYMVILQTDDLDADRARLAALGVRVVWQIALDDIATLHLHPRDIGGAIVSLDQPRPADSWRWAGPHWRDRSHPEVVRGIAGVTLEARDPAGLARRWAEVLALPAAREGSDGLVLALDPGEIRFVGSTAGADGILAVRLAAADAGRALAAARARRLRSAERSIWVGGVRFDLADSD